MGVTPMKRACPCPEGAYLVTHLFGQRGDGKLAVAPAVHDCRYIEERNALIPDASRHATTTAGDNAGRWAQVFMAEMDRRWKTRGGREWNQTALDRSST